LVTKVFGKFVLV